MDSARRTLAIAGVLALPLAHAAGQTSFGASFEVFDDAARVGALSATGRYFTYEAELPAGRMAVRHDLVTGERIELGIGWPQDITADGRGVVGWTNRAGGAFVWTAGGGYVDLNLGVFEFRTLSTIVVSLSDDATVLLGAPVSRPPFLYSTGGGDPGGVGGGRAVELLDDGASVWKLSGDGRYVVGGAGVGGGGFTAVRWDASGTSEVVRANSVAKAISADGSVVAGEDQSRRQGFRWTPGGPTRFLDFLPAAERASVQEMSADGSRIVGAQRVGDANVACVWDELGDVRPMLDVLLDAGLPVAGYEFRDAQAISDDGRSFLLVGFDPDGESFRAVARLGGLCAADVDGDGSLTAFDMLALTSLFDAGDPRADFDGDGTLDVFDFLAFINAFVAGC